MVHRFRLPSQITIYPEKSFIDEKVEGFHLQKKGIHKFKPRELEQTWVKQEGYNPFRTTAHEIGHDYWEQLTPEERDEFILSLERWWKRELRQKMGKMKKEWFVQKKRKFPEEKALRETIETQEYLAKPTEAYARMTGYATEMLRGTRKKIPKWESEEAFDIWKKTFKRRGGTKELKRLLEASKKIEKTSSKYQWLPEKKKYKKLPEFRTMEVSLRGI